MALIQIDLTDPSTRTEEFTDEILAVSRDAGGILLFKGEKSIVRISLNKKEAATVAAKLAPHIP